MLRKSVARVEEAHGTIPAHLLPRIHTHMRPLAQAHGTEMKAGIDGMGGQPRERERPGIGQHGRARIVTMRPARNEESTGVGLVHGLQTEEATTALLVAHATMTRQNTNETIGNAVARRTRNMLQTVVDAEKMIERESGRIPLHHRTPQARRALDEEERPTWWANP